MRYLSLALYVFGFGLLGHGWYSDVLPLSTKLTLSAAALVVIGIGGLIQWKWVAAKE